MPRLSDTMEEGLVGRWLKEPGDSVRRGDEIVEIETDKVTTVLQAESDGVLLEALYAQGETAATGSVLAVVASGADAEGPVVSPGERPPEAERVPATPLARKVAAEAGVDLRAIVKGSGPDGRILRHDVERAAPRRGVGSAPVRPADADVVRKPSRAQQVIARRMADAKREIPHYYLTAEVDMTHAQQLRAAAALLAKPMKLTVTDLVVRAAALALRDVPEVNASWANDAIVQRGAVNIGVAVALDSGELLVPVVRHADRKPLNELSREIRAFAERARDGRLELDDLQGGTFTVSSLGMFGIEEFHAIVNPPESGILAVGAITKQLVLVDGVVAEREVMRISLSADHRVYAGATAALFVRAVRSRLEQPMAQWLETAAEQ
jgi:pyruvate dehydrogenase E2 component (dihydrolipoyllysine-residue acetyltransferase)